LNYQLDDEQKLIAEAIPEGIILGRARAGAGKSSVIKQRVPYILRYRDSQFQRDSRVLLMAFNRRIADELGQYFKATLNDDDQSRVLVKTCHGQATSMVFKYRRQVGIQSDTVEIPKMGALIARIGDWLELDHAELPREPEVVSLAINIDDYAQARGLLIKDAMKGFSESYLLSKHFQGFQDLLDYVLLIRKFRHTRGLLTFGDTLVLANKLPAWCFQKYNFIDVIADEVQDLNYQQRQLVLNYMQFAESFTAMGDAEQAINTWAGADAGIFDIIKDQYPDRTITEAYITKTYRCAEPIIQVANQILAKDLNQEALMTGTGKLGAGVSTYTEGAKDLLAFIEQRLNAGDGYKDIAILYRTRKQTLQLEMELAKARIPYVMVNASFFEQREIQDILAYFHCLYNPALKYDHWRRVVGHVQNLGGWSAETIFHEYKERPFNHIGPDSRTAAANNSLRAEAWEKLKKRILKCHEFTSSPKQLAEYLIDLLWNDWCATDTLEQILDRKELVSGFVDWIANFGPKVNGLEVVDTVTMYEQGHAHKLANADAIRVMTAHSAKGLEWPTVVLWNIGLGMFPLNKQTDIEINEEQRLLYVAVTRAKNCLALISPNESAYNSVPLTHYAQSPSIRITRFIDWSMLDAS
jgi:DNA helicase-2/ATP-dependent DNA helicase PcrA